MSPEAISKQIGKLKDRYDVLEAKLPHARNIDEYDRIAHQLEIIGYQIEILKAQRDLARMEQAAGK